MNKIFRKIIEEICLEEKIECKILSKDWIIMLEKNGVTKFIAGYKFDINGHGLGNVVDDKYALYEVLNAKNIPIIEHKIIYNSTNNKSYAKDCNSRDIVKKYFLEHDNKIVLKANTGSCGRNVYLVNDIKQIDQYWDILFKKNYSISVCPFYNIKTEYRVVVLDGMSILFYAKQKPIVIGDGKKTIRELLMIFNEHYFKNKLNNNKYDSVLARNEVFEYSWEFNLSKGAVFKEIDLTIKDKIINMALNIAQKINLGFGSIDIVETTDDEFLVMEANSGVMLKNYEMQKKDGYKLVKEIYRKSILVMFSKNL